MATGKVTHNAIYLEKVATPTPPASAHSMLYPDSTNAEFTQQDDGGTTTGLALDHLNSWAGWQRLGDEYDALTFELPGDYALYHLLLHIRTTAAGQHLSMWFDDWYDYPGDYYLTAVYSAATPNDYNSDFFRLLNILDNGLDPLEQDVFVHICIYNAKDTARETHFLSNAMTQHSPVACYVNTCAGFLDDQSAISSVTLYPDDGAFAPETAYMLWGEGDIS